MCICFAVRFVKKSEEMYYDNLIRYSQAHLMLYPYHLADIAVRELRLTPFNYYLQMVMVSWDLAFDVGKKMCG